MITSRSTPDPLRVLMISARADHGGGPKHIETLLQSRDDRVQVAVACPNDPPYRRKFEQLTTLPAYTIPHRRFTIKAALGLVKYMRKQQIDIIHTHGKGAGIYGRLAALLTRKPCIHTPHGVHVETYSTTLLYLYRKYENLTARWIEHLIFVSAEERQLATRTGLWPTTPHSIIVNGVNSISASRVTTLRSIARKSLGIRSNKLVIITVSRFNYQKNMEEAYQVAQLLPEYLFLWLGDGEDLELLKARAKADGLDNITFLGTTDTAVPLLAAADVYFTSSRWEGLPLAVIEAMAVGLPIVASDVTGHHEIVQDSAGGLLYPLGDPAAAAGRLTRLAGHPELRIQMGRAGRKAQRMHYSAGKMTAAVSTLYRQIASST